MTESVAIELRGVRFCRPSGPAGAGFSIEVPAWTVPRGAAVALHGPSGCGKSTLLDLVAGVLPVDVGTLTVLGQELHRLSEDERRAHRIQSVGFVFQDFPLVGYLDLLDNVLLPYRLNPVLTLDDAARSRAVGLLDQLGLSGLGRRRPAGISVGEGHRVAIARALVTSPALLLADEPTTGLDPDTRDAVVRLLVDTAADRGATLLMVTHDPAVRAALPLAVDVAAFSAVT